MTAGSLALPSRATLKRLATRKRSDSQVAPSARRGDTQTVASRVGVRVEGVARAMLNLAPKGIGSEIAAAMGWRIERRGREVAGVEKLSFAAISAEIEVHLAHGRQDAVDLIVAAMLDGLASASVPVTSATTIQFYDRNGQRFLRFDR
jgi:hypothetical protein